MVLVILDRLGASPERQEAWFETYAAASGLAPAPEDGGRVDASNWRDHLGRRELEGDYRGFFLWRCGGSVGGTPSDGTCRCWCRASPPAPCTG